MSFAEAVRFLIDESTRFVSPLGVAAEWVLVALAALVIIAVPFRRNDRLRAFRQLLYRIAHRRKLAIIICGLLPAAIRLSMLGVAAVPEPSIHDEFSHLLLADTLAHGRLTNPTHPMWRHFESIHIIQQPTYNSMYPPAQGAFLALGQVVFHEPWAGAVIGVSLMFAAMCWMMQGWLPPVWAFYGTLIAILKIGVVGFWMNSYMGGAVPAIGGALLVGSVSRLRRREQSAINALLFGLGLVVLMNSRPFEGAVLGVAALAYLLTVLIHRSAEEYGRILRTLVWPAGMVVLCGLLFTGYYCWRVTGSPMRMPYQVNRDTYGWPENLAFLPAKTVVLRHKVLQDMYAKETYHHEIYKSPKLFVDNLVTRVFESWTFFIGPVLTVPFVFLPRIFRDIRTRPLVIMISAIAGLNLFQMVLYPYHLGPVVPILFAIVTQGIRHLYVGVSRLSRQRAYAFALVLPLCLILVGAMKQEAETLNIPQAYWEHGYEAHRNERAYIQAWLTARPAKQLVVVRYALHHPPDQEWVYNGADIDGSKVVWAREMDAGSNAELLDYFSGRESWLLEADIIPRHVVRYSRPVAADSVSEAAHH